MRASEPLKLGRWPWCHVILASWQPLRRWKMWLLPVERDIVACPLYSHLPFLLANGKLICLGVTVYSLGDESKLMWISPADPVAQDRLRDGFGPTPGWWDMKTHLLQDPRKYFIPEKRQLQLKKALLSSLLPCLVSCHRGIWYWIEAIILHPWEETSPPYWKWQMGPQWPVFLTQVTCLCNNPGATPCHLLLSA